MNLLLKKNQQVNRDANRPMILPKKLNKLTFAFCSIFYSIQAIALDTIPSTVEPGRVSQQMNARSPAPNRPGLPMITNTPQQATFPKEVAAIKFKWKGFVFEGNTLFSNQQLMTLFPHKIGDTITLGDIQQFANDITVKYNKDGYLLSQAVIPQQAITSGIVIIKVIEGYISTVSVEGPVSDKTKLLIKKYGEKVVGKKPLNINELESALLLANDLPGMEVRSVISPSKKIPEAADLTLLVIHNLVDNGTYLSYDNRGTRYIGPTRVMASYSVNTLLGDGASTSARLAESGEWQEMRYMELEHKQYFGTNGFAIDFDGQYTRTNPGFILQGTNTIGTNKYFAVNAQYPYIRLRSKSLIFNAGFSFINSFQEQFSSKLYNDQIRTVQAGATYNFLDTYLGSNQASGSLTQGYNYFGASQPNNLVSRIGAKPIFTKINASAGRLQGLPKNFSIMLTGNGQYGFNRMYAYEQIGYGGLPFGDAYDPSEIIADRGIEAKLEIRRDTTFPFNSIPTQYFIYYDGGVLWNYDHINQVGRQTGTSTGFGLRATAFQHINISLELDKPLDRNVAAVVAEPNGGNPRAWRGFFSISVVD